jgi:hypothetical protein
MHGFRPVLASAIGVAPSNTLKHGDVDIPWRAAADLGWA